MGIDINDLNNNLKPTGASSLFGNETVSNNLRELLEEELKTSGGAMGSDSVVATNDGGVGSITVNDDDVTVYVGGLSVNEGPLAIYEGNSTIYKGSFPGFNSEISFDLTKAVI